MRRLTRYESDDEEAQDDLSEAQKSGELPEPAGIEQELPDELDDRMSAQLARPDRYGCDRRHLAIEEGVLSDGLPGGGGCCRGLKSPSPPTAVSSAASSGHLGSTRTRLTHQIPVSPDVIRASGAHPLNVLDLVRGTRGVSFGFEDEARRPPKTGAVVFSTGRTARPLKRRPATPIGSGR